MLKLIFNLFEKRFIKFLNKKNSIKLTKDNLTFSFYDNDGNGYYKFPKDLALPMNRLAKLMGYIKWLSAGITGEELDALLDNADKALMEGIKTGKNAAKIGFVISELRDRKKMVVHDELFYNIIACQIIRQDESPTEFNNDIQLEKVAAFRALNETSDAFFLNISEFLKALNWSNITKQELQEILQSSTTHRAAVGNLMEQLFGQLSENQKATLSKL